MDFGGYIAELREKNGLSLRGLEKKADDLSHVYIWRLEKGDREAPSETTVEKLLKALDLAPREKEILSLLVRTELDDELFKLMQERTDIPFEDFEPVATMSFRGNRPTDRAGWLRLINLVKSF